MGSHVGQPRGLVVLVVVPGGVHAQQVQSLRQKFQLVG